eukprot:6491266-Amphidinium_carterae.3
MRHLDYLMRGLGLDGIKVKALDCPSVKVGMQEVQRRTDELAVEPAECTRYRSGVMRLAYLSLDRPDLAHAVKCLSRHMQKLAQSNLADLKRVGRYLHNHKCLVNVYNRQSWPGKVTVTVDTDFAGDKVTRKSTTGVATFLGFSLRENSEQLAIHG